jgi:WD40 repeat protein
VQKEFVAFADEGGSILLWKLGAKEPEVIVKGNLQKNGIGLVAHVHYTPDRKYIYFAPAGGGFWRHDFKDGRTYGVSGSGGVACVGFADDGLTMLETHAKKRVLYLQPNCWDGRWAPPEYTRFEADIACAAFSPAGDRLAAVTDDGTIRVLDREGLKVAHAIEVKNLRATAVRFSPDGKALAVVGEDGFARVYDAAAGTETAKLKGPKGIVFAVAFSPDGKSVAAGADDNLAYVWDAKGGEALAVLKGHTDSVRAVRFGPDATTMITGSADKTLKVWQLKK